MRHSQRGITLIGWVILLAPLAVVGFAAIRVLPYYLNYSKVTKSMEQVAKEFKDPGSTSPDAVQNALGKRFDVESITHPGPKEIEIHRDGDHWSMVADYEETAPLFYNILLLLQFHKQVDLP